MPQRTFRMSSTRPSRTDMTYDSSPGSKQKATSFFPSTMTTTKMRLVVSAGVFTCLTFLALLLWHPPPRHLDNYDVANPITPSISNNITSELFKPAKPQDFKIVALVFCKPLRVKTQWSRRANPRYRRQTTFCEHSGLLP